MDLKRISIITCLIALTLVFSGLIHPVHAQKDSASVRNLLEKRDKQIKDLVGPKGTKYTEQQRDKLKDIINGVIDYSTMAQYALGKTYDTLSTTKKDEFVNLFGTIIRDQSLNKLDIYRANVSYNEIRIQDDNALVNTTVTLDEVRTPVIYKMEYHANPNDWLVTDMIIDDVSTAESYQNQFRRIINKKGFDYLMKTLRKRASR